MKKYIIKKLFKINNKIKKLYFLDIRNSIDKKVMNIYAEHLTANKKKAKIFYDIEEAKKMAEFFQTTFNESEIIEIK